MSLSHFILHSTHTVTMHMVLILCFCCSQIVNLNFPLTLTSFGTTNINIIIQQLWPDDPCLYWLLCPACPHCNPLPFLSKISFSLIMAIKLLTFRVFNYYNKLTFLSTCGGSWLMLVQVNRVKRKPHFLWGTALCQVMFVASAWKVFPDWLLWASMGHSGSPHTSVVIQWLGTVLGFHLAYMWRLRGRQADLQWLGVLWLCPYYGFIMFI